MGTSAAKWLGQLTPQILGVMAVCAAIAIVLALVRHFLYEHDGNDLKPLSSRVAHVFGFVVGVSFIAVSGSAIAKRFEDGSWTSGVNGNTGKGLLPDGFKEAKSSKNLGDTITAAAGKSQAQRESSGGADLTQSASSSSATTGDGNLPGYEQAYRKAAGKGDWENARKYLSNIAKVASANQGQGGSTANMKNARAFFKAATGFDVGLGDVSKLSDAELKKRFEKWDYEVPF